MSGPGPEVRAAPGPRISGMKWPARRWPPPRWSRPASGSHHLVCSTCTIRCGSKAQTRSPVAACSPTEVASQRSHLLQVASTGPGAFRTIGGTVQRRRLARARRHHPPAARPPRTLAASGHFRTTAAPGNRGAVRCQEGHSGWCHQAQHAIVPRSAGLPSESKSGRSPERASERPPSSAAGTRHQSQMISAMHATPRTITAAFVA